MILLESVLVAFDFSETSNQALTYGINLTRAFGARLHVLHVADLISTSAAQFFPEGPSDPEANASELALRYLRDVLSAAGADDATAEVRMSSDAAKEIIDCAKNHHADIIVVGTHGRSGVSRLLIGSVAEHVVRNGPCPVLVVRPKEHEFVLPEPVTTAARI